MVKLSSVVRMSFHAKLPYGTVTECTQTQQIYNVTLSTDSSTTPPNTYTLVGSIVCRTGGKKSLKFHRNYATNDEQSAIQESTIPRVRTQIHQFLWSEILVVQLLCHINLEMMIIQSLVHAVLFLPSW